MDVSDVRVIDAFQVEDAGAPTVAPYHGEITARALVVASLFRDRPYKPDKKGTSRWKFRSAIVRGSPL